MSSLPEQPIDNLPKEHREAAYKQVGLLLVARNQGIDSEKELAQRAGFPSVEAMRSRLEVWNLSGLLPSTDAAEEKAAPTAPAPTLPYPYGEAVKLPPTRNAIPLFEDAARWMRTEIAHVASLEESLQGGRFMREGGDGRWYPEPDLTRLIGSYLVESGARPDLVERLLHALHPNSEEANRDELSEKLYGKEGLMVKIPQIAALIRGAPGTKRGVKPRSISTLEKLERGR
jgi:hypothetical protein